MPGRTPTAVTRSILVERSGYSVRMVCYALRRLERVNSSANGYEVIRDFFKAVAQVWEEAWGNSNYMITRPVTLKAIMRARSVRDLVAA
jgi:hypothetical protein